MKSLFRATPGRNKRLGLVFGPLFFAALIGQAIAGHADFNNQQIADGGQTKSMLEFVTSSNFAVDVAENWQSEFLAIGSMAVLSIYLHSAAPPESPAEVGGTDAVRGRSEPRRDVAALQLRRLLTLRAALSEGTGILQVWHHCEPRHGYDGAAAYEHDAEAARVIAVVNDGADNRTDPDAAWN